MNQPLNTVKNAFSYFIENLFLDLLLEAVGLVMGIVMFFFIEWKIGFDTIFPFGTLMAAIMLMAFTILNGMSVFARQFNIAIGMGCARKKFLSSYLGTTAVFLFVEVFFLFLCLEFEKLLYPMIFPQIPWEIELEFSISPLAVLLIVFAMLVIKYGSGVFVLHYGRRGTYICLFIYMIITLGGSRIAVIISENPDSVVAEIAYGILGAIRSLGVNGGYIAGYLICIILLVLGIRVGLKEEVRQI